MPDKTTPRRIGTTTRAAGLFLRLEDLEYVDGQGRPRRWESAARQGGATAVLAIPTLQPSGRLVLIRQYRPPVDAFVIEFPAGIVNPEEAPEQAAQRELLEETGFRGRVRWVGPQTCSSPGMTAESVRLVLMDIDEALAANRQPAACLDDGEEIEVHLVEPHRFGAFLRAHLDAGDALDSRTAAYALGLGVVW